MELIEDITESQDAENDRPVINFGDRFFPCGSCEERTSCGSSGDRLFSCHKWKYFLGE